MSSIEEGKQFGRELRLDDGCDGAGLIAQVNGGQERVSIHAEVAGCDDKN